MRVEIFLLGGFTVHVEGAPILDEAWRRRDAAALVKLLALSRGHRLPREQILDALWPDLLVDQAAPRLHKAAHFARTALGHREGVVLSGDVVSLFPGADVVVDVDRFDAAAIDDDPALAEEAVERYRGALLPDDLYEPWTEEPRERLRLRHLELLGTLHRWEDLVAADPADEQAHLQLVREHLRRGDRSAALRQLDHLETVLQRELGVGVSAAAVALRDEAEAMSPDVRRMGRRARSPGRRLSRSGGGATSKPSSRRSGKDPSSRCSAPAVWERRGWPSRSRWPRPRRRRPTSST